jgi:hypothetical protein
LLQLLFPADPDTRLGMGSTILSLLVDHMLVHLLDTIHPFRHCLSYQVMGFGIVIEMKALTRRGILLGSKKVSRFHSVYTTL